MTIRELLRQIADALVNDPSGEMQNKVVSLTDCPLILYERSDGQYFPVEKIDLKLINDVDDYRALQLPRDYQGKVVVLLSPTY